MYQAIRLGGPRPEVDAPRHRFVRIGHIDTPSLGIGLTWFDFYFGSGHRISSRICEEAPETCTAAWLVVG